MNKKIVPLALSLVFAISSCSETSSSLDPASSSTATSWSGTERELFDETMGGHLPPDFDYAVTYTLTGYDYTDRDDLLYDYIVSLKSDSNATYEMIQDYSSLLEDAGYKDVTSDSARELGRFVYEILYSDGIYVQCQLYLNDDNGYYLTEGNGYFNLVFYPTISDYALWDEDIVAGYVSDCLRSTVTVPEPSDTGVGLEIIDWVNTVYGCLEFKINTRDDLSKEYEAILVNAGWEEHFGTYFTNGLWIDPTGEIGLFFGTGYDDQGQNILPYFYIDVYNVEDSFIFSQDKIVDLFYDYVNVNITNTVPDPTNGGESYVYYVDSYLYYQEYYTYTLLRIMVEGDVTDGYEGELLANGYYTDGQGFYVNTELTIYFAYESLYGVTNIEIYYNPDTEEDTGE